MGEADGAPDEEGAEARERQEPGEDCATLGCFVDEGEEAEYHLDDNRPERATALVDVGEPFGSHAALCEGLHCAGAAVRAGVRYGHD